MRISRRPLFLALATAVLAGCGGGSTSSTPPKVAPPEPASCGANPGATATNTVTLTTSAAVQLPTLGYCSIAITIPANNTIAGNALLTATTSLNAPSGVPAPPVGTGTNGVPSGETPSTVFWLTLAPGTGVSLTSPTAPTLSVIFYATGTCSTYYAWTVLSGQSTGTYTTGTYNAATITAAFGGQTNSPATVLSGPEYVAIGCA